MTRRSNGRTTSTQLAFVTTYAHSSGQDILQMVTLFLMGTPCASMTHHSRPLPLDPSRTRFFLPNVRFGRAWHRRWINGTAETFFHQSLFGTLNNFGPPRGKHTKMNSINISLTVTLYPISTTLPSCHFPQRGQEGHISSHFLPMHLLLPMPHRHLR